MPLIGKLVIEGSGKDREMLRRKGQKDDGFHSGFDAFDLIGQVKVARDRASIRFDRQVILTTL